MFAKLIKISSQLYADELHPQYSKLISNRFLPYRYDNDSTKEEKLRVEFLKILKKNLHQDMQDFITNSKGISKTINDIYIKSPGVLGT